MFRNLTRSKRKVKIEIYTCMYSRNNFTYLIVVFMNQIVSLETLDDNKQKMFPQSLTTATINYVVVSESH